MRSLGRRVACIAAAWAAVGIWSVAVSPSSGAAASSKPKVGGPFTTTQASDAKSIDPATVSGSAFFYNQLAYDWLVTVDPVSGKPTMRLAQSLTSDPT